MIAAIDIARSLGLDAAWRERVLTQYRRSACDRGLAFVLGVDEFDTFLGEPCRYCGGAPANEIVVRNFVGTFTIKYQGVDRVDSTRGYEPGNVVPCCTHCNSAKGPRSVAEFREHAP